MVDVTFGQQTIWATDVSASGVAYAEFLLGYKFKGGHSKKMFEVRCMTIFGV